MIQMAQAARMTPMTLEQWLIRAVDLEERLENLVIQGEELEGMAAEKVEFSKVRLENCRLVGCDFSRAALWDVEFQNCDISNCNFEYSYWKQCSLKSCKAQGTDWKESSFRVCVMEDSKFDYASFNRCLMEQVTMRRSSFVSAAIAEARWKKVLLEEDRFDSTDFFKTSLSGVDLSNCDLSRLLLSDDLRELRGAKIDAYQAAEFARMLGMVIV